MQNTIEAAAPQYVKTWYTQNSWNRVSDSTRAPSGGPGPYSTHSQLARFSATYDIGEPMAKSDGNKEGAEQDSQPASAGPA